VRTEAAVVVVGGGIIGCSIAYHLTAAGCRNVVLVEKGELTSGTTFHSVGLVSQFRTSPADMLLMNYSIRLYRELAAELGDAAGWRPVGSLRLASSTTMLRSLHRSVSRARALGLDVNIVTPAEALQICPVMSGKGLHGAVYVPDDGYLEPNGITRELAAPGRGAGGGDRHRDTRHRLPARSARPGGGSRNDGRPDPDRVCRQCLRSVGAPAGRDGRR
jgi:sarcosine dehydrogenase